MGYVQYTDTCKAETEICSQESYNKSCLKDITLSQYAPLVGVPSFIEVSKNRDLHCFFVLVRVATPLERDSPADSAYDDALAPRPPVGDFPTVSEGGLCPRPMWPMMAFAAATDEEPCEHRSGACCSYNCCQHKGSMAHALKPPLQRTYTPRLVCN